MELDDNPVTFKSVADTYRLDTSTLGKAYRDHLSGFRDWEQKPHAADWVLMEDNVGARMGIDETAPSRGDLYTILSNKDGHGRKGSVAAVVRGTRSEDLSAVFARIPLERRLAVEEVTMDFSDSMRSAVEASFPNADITIDCFHVVQLATASLDDIRRAHKREAMAEDARRRREHKARLRRNAEARQKRRTERGGRAERRGRKPGRRNEAYSPPRLANGDTEVELLTRCRHFISKSRDKWTDSQEERAAVLFSLHPDMLAAYTLADELRSIFRNKTLTPRTAAEKLEMWHGKVDKSGFKAMANAADTIMSRLEHVVNYFKERHTNASAESLNSKIKGFRSLLRGVSDLPFFMYRVATVFG